MEESEQEKPWDRAEWDGFTAGGCQSHLISVWPPSGGWHRRWSGWYKLPIDGFVWIPLIPTQWRKMRMEMSRKEIRLKQWRDDFSARTLSESLRRPEDDRTLNFTTRLNSEEKHFEYFSGRYSMTIAWRYSWQFSEPNFLVKSLSSPEQRTTHFGSEFLWLP